MSERLSGAFLTVLNPYLQYLFDIGLSQSVGVSFCVLFHLGRDMNKF